MQDVSGHFHSTVHMHLFSADSYEFPWNLIIFRETLRARVVCEPKPNHDISGARPEMLPSGTVSVVLFPPLHNVDIHTFFMFQFIKEEAFTQVADFQGALRRKTGNKNF